ncbi:MAG: methylated-DNA--[Clostridia bacterium]|nr:methylated-DNA--[protein]-cysteine S-methyltransferase [Clostridia bacterium]
MKNSGIINHFEFESPIGCIAVEDNLREITAVRFLKAKKAENFTEPSELATLAKKQLDEYFSGRRKSFDLPVLMSGTDFQKKVWTELLNIQYGEVCSYKDIAVRIGNPNACRAVGSANNRNNIPIIIPCHRVIGAGGKLVGYSDGLEIKRFLIELEKTNLKMKSKE